MYVLYIEKDNNKSYYTGVYNGFSRKIEDAFKVDPKYVERFDRNFPNYKKEKVDQ